MRVYAALEGIPKCRNYISLLTEDFYSYQSHISLLTEGFDSYKKYISPLTEAFDTCKVLPANFAMSIGIQVWLSPHPLETVRKYEKIIYTFM